MGIDIYAEGEQVAALAISKGVSIKHFRTLALLAEQRKDTRYLENVIKYQTREKGPHGWDWEFANYLLKKLEACEGNVDAIKEIMIYAIMLHPYLRTRKLAEEVLGVKQQILRVAQRACKPHHIGDLKVFTREGQISIVIEIPEFLGDRKRLERWISEQIRQIPQLRYIRVRVEIESK